jgi:hypothetical protein
VPVTNCYDVALIHHVLAAVAEKEADPTITGTMIRTTSVTRENGPTILREAGKETEATQERGKKGQEVVREKG